MDKEPTLAETWRVAWIGAAAALALVRIHPVLGILALLWGSGSPDAVWDSLVGPAIRQEAEMGCVYQAYEADSLVLLAHALGPSWWCLARRRGAFSSVLRPVARTAPGG